MHGRKIISECTFYDIGNGFKINQDEEESRGIKIKAIRAGKKQMGKLMRNLQVILLYSVPKETQV